MILTIFKNDDFENVGFRLTTSVYDRQFMKHTEHTIYRRGISNGWKRDVMISEEALELIKRIMLAEEKKQNLERFRSTFFTILKDNDWYNGQPVKMAELDKEIEEQQHIIDEALKKLK